MLKPYTIREFILSILPWALIFMINKFICASAVGESNTIMNISLKLLLRPILNYRFI
ncbi:hypothetical protein SAMN05421692_2725 [Chryseobacterium indologenes]|nr:hypothetical protein SAMN05421692_2725 [Chryseobacterium indologenes]SUX51071.1 Uncharacterised protein [Chryseobacterium indologenes]